MDSSSLDPRLRELSDKPHDATASPVTSASTSATGPAQSQSHGQGQGSARPPSPQTSNSTIQRDRVQSQTQSQPYDDRQYQLQTPSPQTHAPSHSHSQSQSHPQPPSQFPTQQTQAHTQANARANAQASAHGHGLGRGPLNQPVSELSPDDSASLTPSTPAAANGGHLPAAEAGSPDGDSTHHDQHHDPNHDPKKPRACESCRGLKVRCDPDPSGGNPEGPCKRCAKANRACIITQPTRKRQKKTDNRVAELEKKIDALTASLQATRSSGGPSAAGVQGAAHAAGRPPNPTHSPVSHNQSDSPLNGARGAGPGRENSGYGASPNQQGPGSMAREWGRDQQLPAMQHTPSQRPLSYSGMDHDAHQYGGSGSYPSLPPINAGGQKRKYADSREAASDDMRDSSSATPQPRAVSAAEQPDIVDRGIITMVQACELFARYNDQMMPHLPGVVFSPNMTAAELRRTKPILFLAIMAVASSNLPPVQRTLTREMMEVFAQRVIVVGKKSLELVQALQVAVIWYYPPEHFEELKFYQLLHIAAVMAIDLGLGRKKQFKGGLRKHLPLNWRDHPLRKRPVEDPTTLEARRAWLTCYFLATNSSMALHRPNLIRWTPFMAECVDILESSPEAAPTDKYFCQLIYVHRLAEDVGIQFSMDDPTSTANIAEIRTQYALKGFEVQLERFATAVPKEQQPPSLTLTYHVLDLYMHEIATQSDFSDEYTPPLIEPPPKEGYIPNIPLTSAHINCISACLRAVDGIFDVFLSLDVTSTRCLPVFSFVRVAYAVVVLMKIYFAASAPKSELGKVMNKDHMKVEQHLEALLEKFGATAADDRSRPASKFLVVLIMLRSWFQKQKQMGTGAEPTTPAPFPSRHNSDKSEPIVPQQGQGRPTTTTTDYSSTANTPLQLLSEIATNNSAVAASTSRPGSNISDLLSSNPNPNSQPTSSTNGRAPWAGRPSAFVFDPAGAADAAADTSNTNAASSSWMDTTAAGSFAPPNFGDYSITADGFAQAMDLTLGGLTDTDGSFGGVMMGMMGFGFEGMFGAGAGAGGLAPLQGAGAGRYGQQQQEAWYNMGGPGVGGPLDHGMGGGVGGSAGGGFTF